MRELSEDSTELKQVHARLSIYFTDDASIRSGRFSPHRKTHVTDKNYPYRLHAYPELNLGAWSVGLAVAIQDHSPFSFSLARTPARTGAKFCSTSVGIREFNRKNMLKRPRSRRLHSPRKPRRDLESRCFRPDRLRQEKKVGGRGRTAARLSI